MGLSIQRTMREGPFEIDDKRALLLLSRRLTETTTLSKAVGKAVLVITNALNLIKQRALAFDRMGFVLAANAAAEGIFDDEVRVSNRRLVVRDKRARSALGTLLDRVRTTPDMSALPAGHIFVARRAKRPIVIRILPVDGAARSPFLGARALLVLQSLDRPSGPDPIILSKLFGLSPAEAKLASIVATGIPPQQAGNELGIAVETVRTQLKAVFAKTETHRQAELVALMSRL
jgi:DNA-binding CsgD family transcriptional regulator